MRPVEERLGHVDQHHVGHDQHYQDEEEGGGQGGEPQEVAQAGERQDNADRRRGRGDQQHRQAGAAPEERYPPGADHIDDQCLGRDGLHEPAGAELGGAGMEKRQQNPEGDEVKDRAEAPAALNMFPKFEDVAISTYFIVLAKIRLPSITPVASTPRSFSSSTTSAASLATSVPESTDMPTSA
jgi:hypothetical protein